MTDHCCEAMVRQVDARCDQHHGTSVCPDALIGFDARFQEYGLIVHDGGTSSVDIHFCPWCGRALPQSQRDRWFDELERRGIDPWEGEIPAEFQDDRWLATPPRD
ncbi:hypothetical protein STRCI_000250 [Streptomyces cinnabarinus]|uniref:DUF6980 domain-containing protein n=1 Tax=Streptomyces cinnabarinus TaxID=67287 RepID=A0ABY7K3Z2_9ACTN|nr:hypothetical protein [Streptomyces cinnabarinus]WAZ19215.1 hypothetical protein STRCI_000250 [Streptomyces cinnabarinus]